MRNCVICVGFALCARSLRDAKICYKNANAGIVTDSASVPLELSGQKESGLRYATQTNYRTENYQMARHGLENGLAPFR